MDRNPIKDAKLSAGFLLSLSINLLIVSSLQFDLSSKSIVLYHTLLWGVIYLSRKLHWRTKIFLILGSIILGMITHRQIILGETGYVFLKWSLLYILGNQLQIHIQYAFYLTLLIFGIVNFLVLKYMLFTKAKWLRLIPVIYFVIQWYRHIDQAFIYLQVYLFVLMLLTIMDNYKQSGLEEKVYEEKNQKFSVRSWLLYSLLVSFSIIGIANLIPLQFKALQVRELADQISEKFPNTLSWRREENKTGDFRISENRNSIFAEQLGGPILRDDRIVMLVKSERPVYLRGNIKAIYTGKGWKSSRKSFKKSEGEGKVPSFYSHDIFFEDLKVEIQPVGINTKVLYAPYRPSQVLLPSGNVYYDQDYELYRSGIFLNNKKQTYTIYSKLPRLKTTDLLKQQPSIMDVSQDYLDIPQRLPTRVKKLAKDLTANVEGDYSKMKNIEQYLRQNYPYTLNGATLPAERDFVDYFLFETKKGYCSYYASALAVLGRCIGIPTRYVEGFILPQVKNEEGIYEVAASSAHAWVEAYIEGQGWISFEATPAFSAVEVFMENEGSERETEFSIDGEGGASENGIFQHFRNRREHDEDESVNGAVTVQPQKIKYLRRELSLLFILFFLRIGYCTYNNKKRSYRIAKETEMLQDYGKIVNLASFEDSISIQGCTPREVFLLFGDKICPELLDQNLIEHVEKGLYSSEGATTEDIEQIRIGARALEIAIKKQLGLPKYWFHKYLVGDLYTNRKKKA